MTINKRLFIFYKILYLVIMTFLFCNRQGTYHNIAFFLILVITYFISSNPIFFYSDVVFPAGLKKVYELIVKGNYFFLYYITFQDLIILDRYFRLPIVFNCIQYRFNPIYWLIACIFLIAQAKLHRAMWII